MPDKNIEQILTKLRKEPGADQEFLGAMERGAMAEHAAKNESLLKLLSLLIATPANSVAKLAQQAGLGDPVGVGGSRSKPSFEETRMALGGAVAGLMERDGPVPLVSKDDLDSVLNFFSAAFRGRNPLLTENLSDDETSRNGNPIAAGNETSRKKNGRSNSR